MNVNNINKKYYIDYWKFRIIILLKLKIAFILTDK